MRRIQIKADLFMQSEIQHLMIDYSVQKAYYHNDRVEFWKSRKSSYNAYIKYPNSFSFIDVEIYKEMATSKELNYWVENK